MLCTTWIITYIFIELLQEKKRHYDEKYTNSNEQERDIVDDEVETTFRNTEKKLIERAKNNSHLEKVFFPSPIFHSRLSQYCNQNKDYMYGYQYTDMYRDFSKKNVSRELEKHIRTQYLVHVALEKERLKFSDAVYEYSSEDDLSDHGQESFSIGKLNFGDVGNIGKDIGKAMDKAKDPLKEITDFINKIKKAFESIPDRVNKFNRAFKTVGYGIEKEFESIGKSLHIGVSDVFNLIGAAGECGKKFVLNLNSCILWYLMNMTYDILYGIFIELPVFTLRYFFGFDVSGYLKDISSLLNYLDAMFIEQTTFSFLHFPDHVIQKCYSCDIGGQIRRLQTDFETTIPNIMNEPNQIFQKAKSEFNEVFN